MKGEEDDEELTNEDYEKIQKMKKDMMEIGMDEGEYDDSDDNVEQINRNILNSIRHQMNVRGVQPGSSEEREGSYMDHLDPT